MHPLSICTWEEAEVLQLKMSQQRARGKLDKRLPAESYLASATISICSGVRSTNPPNRSRFGPLATKVGFSVLFGQSSRKIKACGRTLKKCVDKKSKSALSHEIDSSN